MVMYDTFGALQCLGWVLWWILWWLGGTGGWNLRSYYCDVQKIGQRIINLAPFFCMNRWLFYLKWWKVLLFRSWGIRYTSLPLPSLSVHRQRKTFHWSIGFTVLPWCWRTGIKDGIIGVFFFDGRCSDTTLCSFKTSCRIVIRFDTWRDDIQKRLKEPYQQNHQTMAPC